MDEAFTLSALALGLLALLPAAKRRIELSRAKHRSLAGHSRMAKRLARWVPGYAYDESQFFNADGAPDAVAAQRRAALLRLGAAFDKRFAKTLAATGQARDTISDLRFTGRYRVPFQFSPVLREHLKVGAFLQHSEGVQVEDLDGNRFYDLTGSYGVNLLGYDAYKECIDEAVATARDLGPVLGAY
ncbi:MAG: aminotransferase class III-fold pyridoxal phosphate-dependent enzyme, partial [Roseateles sp.]